MIIGFDFDKVFIDYPPLLPYSFVDFLYKGTFVFNKNGNKNSKLHYRFPGSFEQKIRILSHFPLFRQPIKKNLNALKSLTTNKKNKAYLVSSRFGFLRKRTETLLDKYRLRRYFAGIYFNYKNQQPHIFKEQTIKSLGIDIYIDDDLDLSLYLSKQIPKLKIFWISNIKTNTIDLPNNIISIRNLTELKKYINGKWERILIFCSKDPGNL